MLNFSDKQKKKKKEKPGQKTNEITPEVDLTVLRLKFEVFIRGQTKYDIPLNPVYSEPIYNATAYPSLSICRLSRCSCSTNGGETILLFCDKVNKDDVDVKFFEEINGVVVWEANGTIQHVHKKFGISLETPKYGGPTSMRGIIKCFIQLRRISDGEISEPRQFDYIPNFPNDFDLIELKRKKAKMDPLLQKFLIVEDAAVEVPRIPNQLNVLPNLNQNITFPSMDMFPVASEQKNHYLKAGPSKMFNQQIIAAPTYEIFPGTSTDYRKADEFCFAGITFEQQIPNLVPCFENPMDSEIIPKEGFSDELLAFVNEVIENNLEQEQNLSGKLENLMLNGLNEFNF